MQAKILFLPMLFVPLLILGQDSSSKNEKFLINGYVKSLQTWNAPGKFEQLYGTNIIHNRINMQLHISPKLKASLSFRNRFIWGDEVRQTSAYANMLRNKQELMNLSFKWIQQPDWVFHTNTERMWLDYNQDKWNVRIGRQRINWGVTTVWNPSDLFNTYNFLDVDYEERPGSDAIKTTYQIQELSDIEIVFAPGKIKAKYIGAVRYTFHKKTTDFQIVSGIFYGRLTVGGGWAGHLGNTGWKGECQYYSKRGQEKNQLNASTEFDYAFQNGWYVNGGFLFNSSGITKNMNNKDSLRFEFSPLQLMPTKFNFVFTGRKEISPIFSISSSVLFSPNSDLLLFLPALSYNIADNIDADFIWQSYFAREYNFKALNHRGFLRIRRSF